MRIIFGAVIGAYTFHWFYVDKTCFWMAIITLGMAAVVEVFLDFCINQVMKENGVGNISGDKK